MSHCLVTADFGDGTYPFALYLGQWEELQEITGIGPRELCQRLIERRYLARWPREIHRLGLIGAGMKPVQAKKLVERYCDSQPFEELLPLAAEIVLKAIVKIDDEAAKKKDPEPATAMAESDFASSMGTVQ